MQEIYSHRLAAIIAVAGGAYFDGDVGHDGLAAGCYLRWDRCSGPPAVGALVVGGLLIGPMLLLVVMQALRMMVLGNEPDQQIAEVWCTPVPRS